MSNLSWPDKFSGRFFLGFSSAFLVCSFCALGYFLVTSHLDVPFYAIAGLVFSVFVGLSAAASFQGGENFWKGRRSS